MEQYKVKRTNGKLIVDEYIKRFGIWETIKFEKDQDIESLLESYIVDQWCNTNNAPDTYLDEFEIEYQPEAHGIAVDYVSKVLDGTAGNLVFCSPDMYGVGKTHLAAGIVQEVISHWPIKFSSTDGNIILPTEPPAYFITEGELLARVRATYRPDAEETEAEIIHKMASYKLLVIDDIGKHKPSDLTFTQRVLFEILNGREKSHKPTLATSNFDVKGLEKHISGAGADRLLSGLVVFMRGNSYRRRNMKVIVGGKNV